jgi:tRNA pseudouridine38-40 synthase
MHYYYPLDVDKMNEAAAYLVGEHDFASFAASGFSAKTTVRTIMRAGVVRTGDRVIFTVTGNGFLYNMVRIIAGTLLDIGTGLMEPDQVDVALRTCDRADSGPTAPAQGLTMIGIEYL